VGEIQVAIGPGTGPGRYRVEVVRSPAGEASAQVSFDADALLGQRKVLEDAVLLSSLQTRTVFPEEQRVRDAGRELFRALLGAGPVASRYRAAERDDDLRIVLRVNDPELAGLPWEAMYDDESGGYVCRRHQLVRHIGVPAAAAPLAVTPPLRILGVVSSPRGLPPLEVEKEQEQLARALSRLTGDGLVELTWAPTATWADLHDTLLGDTWHVLHYIGHGDFDPGRDEGVLALTSETGRLHLVDGSRFIDLLRQSHPVPRLVVLNSCSGAASNVTDLFSGTAAALVRGGVTAVAAMQYEITDDAAIAFARGFYGAIAHGRGVDEAVSSARVAILGLSSRTLEWVTPVLYLRGEGTHLFSVPEAVADPPATAQPESVPPVAVRPRAPIPARTLWTLTGHTGAVVAVAFRPDGTLLATTSTDGTARLWDTATGEPVRTLIGHEYTVFGAAFSPDGIVLATTGMDRTIRLWDASAGQPVRVIDHEAMVHGVAFSPDGTVLATGGDDQTARLWDPATGRLTRTLRGHTSTVDGVAFSPDGALLATASYDRTVRLWNLTAHGSDRILRTHQDQVLKVAFSPDATLLATAGAEKEVRLWDVATGLMVHTLTGHTDKVGGGVAFSPDGALLATASHDASVRLWDVATGATVRTLAHARALEGVAFSPDGVLLATASNDRTARLWGAG
jgi:WD40 repeat protein